MTEHLWAIAGVAMLSSNALADMGRSCEPRALTAEEQAAGARLVETLRRSMPPAPAGWTLRDERPVLASGTCETEDGGKRLPLPVSVTVSRVFKQQGQPPEPPPPAAAQRPSQPSSDPGAQARMQAAGAARRDASVSIAANLRQRDVYPARRVEAGGAPLALRDGSGTTHLFYGPWRRSGNFALASLDESAPTTRVQALSMRIDASEAMTEQLLGKLDLTAVKDLIASGPAQTQIRRQPAQPQTSPVQIALRIGTTKYESGGQAECNAAPQASIYGVPAALYSVSQRSGSGSLNLTLWQPKDGAAVMMSLRIAAGGRSYLVDTVKAGPKRDTKGSGKATLQQTGAGGVIAVDAVDAGGEKITGKIECTRFGAIRAEGG